MLASTLINTDRAPWRERGTGRRFADADQAAGSRAALAYEPRPEWDNQPNMLLIAFRSFARAHRRITTVSDCAWGWLLDQDGPLTQEYLALRTIDIETAREQLAHARRVLTRLAAQGA
ncbi:hypothetical protein ACXR2T_07955 [Leucobacter sp. HY1910]